MTFQVATAILSFVLAITMPLVAYPLALGLKRGRQALDDKINWQGDKAEVREQVEDAMTYGSIIVLSFIVFLVIGVVFLWYVDSYTLNANLWLFAIIGNAPLIGFNEIGYYNATPAVYWLIAYWVSFSVGWLRAKGGK